MEEWIAKLDNVQIVHIRTLIERTKRKDNRYIIYEDRGPVGTIALRKRDDGTIAIGMALVSSADNFSYSVGRSIAVRRLLKDKTTLPMSLSDSESCTIECLIACGLWHAHGSKLIRHLSTCHGRQQRLRRLAQSDAVLKKLLDRLDVDVNI